MRQRDYVGLDSQCYTYLIDAMSNTLEPSDKLAAERIALFRALLYRPGGLFLTPTVRREFEAIPSACRAAHHVSWAVLFPETQPIDQPAIDRRAVQLGQYHNDFGDCCILAEAEDSGLNGLLTFDKDFISHLSSHTCLTLQKPVDFWNWLDVQKGATPVTIPTTDNPQSGATWWRWV